jgi:hypothetical protein
VQIYFLPGLTKNNFWFLGILANKNLTSANNPKPMDYRAKKLTAF